MLSISKKVLLTFLICVLTVFLNGCLIRENEKTQLRSTIETANLLTNAHEAEVSQMISNFVLEAGSIEARRNRDILKELVTEQFFNHSYILTQDELDDAPYWIITKSTDIDHIRVVDYRPNEIKTVACQTIVHEEVTVNGGFLETYPAIMRCSIYVFINDEGDWKVAAVFGTTIPGHVARDWTYAPDWLKEVIGELPNDPSMMRERTP